MRSFPVPIRVLLPGALFLALAPGVVQAQSKTELQAQVTRLQTDLAESRKFVSDLSDRLAVLESQQEALLRLRRDLEATTAERDGLGKRLAAVETEAATLRQNQAALQERQQALTNGPQFYNATPSVAGRAGTRSGAAGGDSVEVSDSMSYLTASDSTATETQPKRRTYKAKPTRKKVKVTPRKRRRR